MLNSPQKTIQQPMIVKYVQPYRNGSQSHNLSRHGIGYVIRGKKLIYNGDICHEVNRGDLFFLSAGTHYIEDIPEENRPFEQIVFFYTPDQLGRILSHLSMTYNMNIEKSHSCENCYGKDYVIYPAWNAIKNFFATTNQYIKDDLFSHDETAENIKMTELIYLIVSQKDCCLKSKILSSVDQAKESFEKTVRNHIFVDISIGDLAKECNRSLTSFKKEFKRHFFEPPHKWFIKQRLTHARMLLITTDKSIAEIGIECNFPNTSHFIKLYKKEYGMTPAVYRNKHAENTFGEIYSVPEKAPVQHAQ